MNIKKLTEDELYEYIKSLPKEDQYYAVEEIYQNLDNIENEDTYIQNFNNVIERLEDDMKQREKFYFKLYYLIDEDNNLTKLGKFYKNVFKCHYIKALKIYMTFSKTLKEKNKIFKKNEKAYEYLQYFKYNIKGISPTKILKR